MTGLVSLDSAHGSTTLAVMIDAAFKAAVLIVTFLALHAALGRRRAVVRSTLWNTCLLGLLLLPVASLMLPRLRIFVPTVGEIAPVQNLAAAPDDLTLQNPSSFQAPGESVKSSPGSFGSEAGSPAILEPSSDVAGATPGAASPQLAALPVNRVVVGVYVVVAVLLTVRLSLSLVAIGRLIRPCKPVDEAPWTAALGRWRLLLGIRRDVRLLESDHVSVPIVIGWQRPAIVLPTTLLGSEKSALIDAILLHELGHIRRGDYGWNLVRKLVQVVYWPHPLVWLVGRIVGAVREQVCDDLCVHGLGGALVYRDSLVEVASGLVRRPDAALGLAMARGTNLGRRLRWIDRTRGASRCLLRWPAQAALAATVLACAGVLGSIELAHATTKAADPPTDFKVQAKEESKPQSETKAGTEKGPAAIEIQVLAKDSGKALEGATVRPSVDLTTFTRKTDREGKVRIDLSQRKLRDSFGFDVWADGYIQQRFFFSQDDARFPKIPTQFTVELLPGEQTLGGKVVNEEGKPIAGVKVEIWGYLGEKKNKNELAYMVEAITDAHGQWRSRCFRDMQFAYLYLSHPDYVTDGEMHPRRHGKPQASAQPQPGDQPIQSLRDFTDLQVMTRGVEVAGKVVDEHAKAVVGAEVGWMAAADQNTFHESLIKTISNAEGRFRIPHVRPGRFNLLVQARGHAPELRTIGTEEARAVILKMGPPRVLAGRVVDSAGNPIPGAFVNIDTWRGCRALGVFLASDGEGRFHWDDAPNDTVLINADKSGYSGVFQQPASRTDSETRLTLTRSRSITGRIKDSETGKPIEQAFVEVGVPDPKTHEIHWSKQMSSFASQGHLQSEIDVEKTPEFRLRIGAEGYEPFESRLFQRHERQVEYNVDLRKAKATPGEILSGVVHRPDGTPLAGATIAIAYPTRPPPTRGPSIRIEGGALVADQIIATAKTDASGRFSIARDTGQADEAFALIVVHPEFYGEFDRSAIQAHQVLTAKPWGRIEGVARVGGHLAPDTAISYFSDRLRGPGVPRVVAMGHSTTDVQGQFVFDRVVPGEIRVNMEYGRGSERRGSRYGPLVAVKPGQTSRIEIGGTGRPVIARIEIPEGFDPDADYSMYSQFNIVSDGFRNDAPNNPRRFRLDRVMLQAEGTLRAEDVPAGKYHLNLVFTAAPISAARRSPERFAVADAEFTIPNIPGGRSDQPFDLGILKPKPRETQKKP